MSPAHGRIRDLAARFNEVVGSDVPYDTLVGTGLSGSLVVPRLADVLGCHWLVLRKETDVSHTLKQGEGTLGAGWLFVDDLIDSGRTYNRCRDVVAEIAKDYEWTTVHLGSFLYRDGIFCDPSHTYNLDGVLL
jgi:hypoxanthine phosphoribosyltransferase